MKKFFKYLGISLLLSISFFYTEKTASVVKELDEIMLQIRDTASKEWKEPIESILTDTTIIPGINGYEVDINNSYKDMRYLGKYNANYLKYKPIYVKEKLLDNLDKNVISGNPNKKSVSIVFIVDNNDNIDTILNILKVNKIESTFLIDGTWLENNNELLYLLKKDNHSIGSIGYNYSYENSSYPWLDNIIKRVIKEKNSYCIKVDSNTSKICESYNNITIDSQIISNNSLINTKKILQNGSILVYKINSKTEEELELIIKYINSKGLDIINIKNLLSE